MEASAQVASEKFGLDQLMPEDAEVTIGGKVYGLRKLNLHDEAWLKQFGNIDKRFKAEDMDFMAKMCFRQLKDKADFLPKEESGYDNDGNEITVKLTGPQRILLAMAGPSAKFNLIEALMVTIGISRPMFNQMIEDAVKKNELIMEAAMNPIGEKSST